MTYAIIRPVRPCVSGLVWPARQHVLRQSVSLSPGWRDPRWQRHQLDNRPTTGRLQVPQWVATDRVTSSVSKNKNKNKKKRRQNKTADKMKTKTTITLSLAHRCVFQPSVANRRPRTRTLKEHQHSLTWQRKLSNVADWAQPLPEGEAPRGDCGFTIDERGIHVWKLPGIPAGETVSSKQACFHDAGCLAHSELTCLSLQHQTLQTDRGMLIRSAFHRGEKGATCRKDGLLLLDSTESLTKIRLNQHMANRSGTKAGLILPKIRDKPGSEEGRCGLCSPVSTKVWDISRERLS